MPLEIRELVIRAVVEPERPTGRPALQSSELERLKRELVAECLARLAEQRGARLRR